MHHWNDELLVGCKDWTVRQVRVHSFIHDVGAIYRMTMFCSQWSLPEDAVRGAKVVPGSNPPGAKFDAHVREYDDLHRGVVRCVRWNTPDVDDVINDESTMNNSNGLGGALFASCGNDGCVAVVDTRLPTNRAKVAGVDGAHGGRAVNFVEWGRGAGSAFSYQYDAQRPDHFLELGRKSGCSHAHSCCCNADISRRAQQISQR